MSRQAEKQLDTLARACAVSLRALAERSPRIHCITNTVAMGYTANMLLAVGAIPSMTLAPAEVSDFVAAADALCVNIGTLDEQRRQAIELALQSAVDHRKPWVLDPVLVNVSEKRLAYAKHLLRHQPAVVRGNSAEITALDAGDETVIAETGPVDHIYDRYRSLRIANGHPLMARVTALGCAASALLAAFIAVTGDAFAAAAQTLLALDVAGERAAEIAAGPGSFQIAILDELYRLDEASLTQRGRLL